MPYRRVHAVSSLSSFQIDVHDTAYVMVAIKQERGGGLSQHTGHVSTLNCVYIKTLKRN